MSPSTILVLTLSNTLTLILPILAKLPNEFFTQDPPVTLLFNNEDGPSGRIQ